MAERIQFRVLKDDMTPFVKKFGKKAPVKIGEALFDIAKLGSELMKREIQVQGLIGVSSPHLHQRIEARKKSRFRSMVFIPQYGEYLDSMRTHWVSLKRGRNITKWAKTKLKKPLPKAIEVRAHPWIDKPLRRTGLRSLKIMNKRLNEAMAK